MESQESLIQSITHADEDESGNNTTESVPPPVKSRYFILEPAILLLFFAWNVAGINRTHLSQCSQNIYPSPLIGTIFQNQIIYQTCTEIFGFNKTECILLGTPNSTNETQTIERLVQPYAAKIFMARTLIESIIPALVSMFIGPWSDKFGRKPVIVSTFVGEYYIRVLYDQFAKLSIVGYFIIYLSITVISYLSTVMAINPWFYLLPFVPISLCGGTCALITGAFSYLSTVYNLTLCFSQLTYLMYLADVTTQQDRPIRMAYLEASLYIGLLFGSLSSSYILMLTSPTAVFGIAGIANFLGVLYVIFFVKESIQQDESVGKFVCSSILLMFTIILSFSYFTG